MIAHIQPLDKIVVEFIGRDTMFIYIVFETSSMLSPDQPYATKNGRPFLVRSAVSIEAADVYTCPDLTIQAGGPYTKSKHQLSPQLSDYLNGLFSLIIKHI